MKATCKRNLRLLATTCALSMLACTQGRADYSSTILNSSPAGYWRFNESATTVASFTATNLGSLSSVANGTFMVDATTVKSGAIANDGAAYFPQTSGSRVRVPFNTALNPTAAFSVEFWAKPGQTNGIVCPAASADFTASTRYGWLFYQGDTGLSTGNGWFFRIYKSGGNSVASVTSILDTNAWYHVVGVYDGSNVYLYTNGTLAATSAASGYTTNAYTPLTFGGRADGTAGYFDYNGYVDEPAIYGTALSAADIAKHYSTALSNPAGYPAVVLANSPLGYWRLDETTSLPSTPNFGTTGAACNGSYVYSSTTVTDLNSPTYPGLETTNTVLSTSGTNGYVQAPALNLNTNAVTFECWFKPNGTQEDYAGLFFHRGGSSSASGIMYRGTSGELGYHWNDTQYGWSSKLTPADGVWNYAALAVQPDKATLYLWDGSTLQSAVNTVTHDIQAFAGITRVGTDSGSSRFFKGLVDEAAIYPTTLGEGQVRTHILAATGTATPPILLNDPIVISPEGIHYSTVPFTLSIDAYGTPPMVFTWRKDGVVITKTTNVWSYSKVGAVSDSGSYDVLIENAQGSVSSTPIYIGFDPAVPPQFDVQPASRSTYQGGIVKFNAAVSGTTPISLQWKHAGTNIPGATNLNLTISNVDSTVTGAYVLSASNIVGTVPSTTAILTLRTPSANSYEAAVLAAGPKCYWRMNETTGVYAQDIMSNIDATNTDGTLLAQNGPRSPHFPGFESGNYAYYYDGVSGQSSTGMSLLNNVTNATVCGWVNISGGFTQSGLFGQNDVVEFRFKNASTIELWSNKGSLSYIFTKDITVDNWAFVAYTISSNNISLYVNDSLVASATATASEGYGTSSEPFIFTGDTSGNRDNPIGGFMDEVALFPRTLSAEEINKLYVTASYGQTKAPFITLQPVGASVAEGKSVTLTAAASGSVPRGYQWYQNGTAIIGATNPALTIASITTSDNGTYTLVVTNSIGSATSSGAILTVYPTPAFANLTNGLVLHLTFDGVYTDSTSKSHDATVIGDAPFVAGQVGQAMHIASSLTDSVGNNYAFIDTASDLEFDETASFTVGFWVRYTSQFSDVPIIGISKGSTYQLGWVFTDSSDKAGHIQWSLASTANSGTYVRDPIPNCPVVNDGKWHHVVGVVDRSLATAFAYIDGTLASSWSIAGMETLAVGNPIVIGQDTTFDYGSATFDIDDLGIWNRALNGYEATSAYVAGQSGKSFTTYGPVSLHVTRNQSGDVELGWQAGTLQSATSVAGPWTNVSGATAPYLKLGPTDSAKFYRIKL